jgi:hypothetical protein
VSFWSEAKNPDVHLLAFSLTGGERPTLSRKPIVKIISKAEDFASFENYKKWLAKNEGKIRVVNVVYNPDRLGMFRSKRYLVTYEVQEAAESDPKPDHWKF